MENTITVALMAAGSALAGVLIGGMLSDLREDRAREVQAKREAYVNAVAMYRDVIAARHRYRSVKINSDARAEAIRKSEQALKNEENILLRLNGLATSETGPTSNTTFFENNAKSQLEKVKAIQGEVSKAREELRKNLDGFTQAKAEYEKALAHLNESLDRILIVGSVEAAEHLSNMIHFIGNVPFRALVPEKGQAYLKVKFLDAAHNDLKASRAMSTRAVEFFRIRMQEADEFIARELQTEPYIDGAMFDLANRKNEQS